MNETLAPLVLAIPSKGRLQENAAAFFARAGLRVKQARGSREYRGVLEGIEGVEIAFLSAGDIVTQLVSGGAHIGITGEDLVRETIPDADAKVELLTPLGFGQANVVVAVPRAWIDVRTMADLEDVASAYRAKRSERMRVATKYVNLTRRFFSAQHVTDYRIVESLGATEGAPAAGHAELIVDITTTGATLLANALKILDDGVILRSEANLVASLTADWNPLNLERARKILSRIAAEEKARTTREVTCFLPGLAAELLSEAQVLFSASISQKTSEGRWTFNCPQENAAPLADWLIGAGAETVTVAALEYVFCAENTLYRALLSRFSKNTMA